jgi:hypothetical protein
MRYTCAELQSLSAAVASRPLQRYPAEGWAQHVHLGGLQLLLLCGGGRLERRLALGQLCVQPPQLCHLFTVTLQGQAAVCTMPMLAPQDDTKSGGL